MFAQANTIGIIGAKGLLFIAALLVALFTSFNSHAAALTVVSQPSSKTITEGSSISFTVKATSSRTIRYAWFKNGIQLNDKNSRTLTISKATPSNAGTFYCKVTDGVTTIRCKSFTLSVNKSGALSITRQPADTVIYEGKSTTFSVATNSTKPLTYAWYKDGSQLSNKTASTLTISSATPGNAGTFSCKVSDGVTTVSCASFKLTVNKIVRITQQPVNQIQSAGTSASLSVTATGTAPLSYQWYYNGTAISGATTSTLKFASATVNNSGKYYCVVKNPGSSATSTTASLSISSAAKTGSVKISWARPTTRADGTALAATSIAGYDLYHSSSSASSMTRLSSLTAAELSIVVTDLSLGTHYFALATKDASGMQSKLSSTITVSIQ
ncbi:MAG: immunoglobulin domain-containing protein [Pseudomonadota bacterium]